MSFISDRRLRVSWPALGTLVAFAGSRTGMIDRHAKYVERIEAVDSLSRLFGGKGYWEDNVDFEWYAGI